MMKVPKKKISRKMMKTMTRTMNQVWKKVRFHAVDSQIARKTHHFIFISFGSAIPVYNEDLEEDNSDWNEVGEDEDEDEIDSDGKTCDNISSAWCLIFGSFSEDADETAEKVGEAGGEEGEGKVVFERFWSEWHLKFCCFLSAESPARGKKRKHEGD